MRLLWLTCLIVFGVILPGQCSASRSVRCPANEEYVRCVNRCNTCSDRGGYCQQDKQKRCQSGCDCKKGYLRNREGKCVLKKLCDDPGPSPCKEDEEFKECSCVRTCCNKDNAEACADQCLTGCFCKGNLVRDKSGNCVEPEDCPAKEPPETCGRDEQYYENKPDCKNTCENYDNPAILCLIGEPGCFCKDGLVKRKDGQCVPPEECGKGNGTCGYNEEIVSCAKPKWCNTCEIKGNCKLKACTEGCDCKPGFYRDSQGICIEEALCPDLGQCGENEEFTECGTACPDTCDNYGKPRQCTLQCVIGCACKEGYVKDKNGKCILPEKCPKKSCKRNEVYQMCGTACPETCKGKPEVCTRQCVPGCFCRNGFVRSDETGECVTRSQCPPKQETCGKNEEYTSCGSACAETCKGKPEACIQACIPGCFCRKGFLRNDKTGECVTRRQCPPKQETCGRNEVYQSCGTACPETCKNKPEVCTLQCVPGCFCKNGFVRNDETGKCVTRRQCPPNQEICPRNEVYQSCGTACPETCDNRGKRQICTKQCVRGCFCRKGLVRNCAGLCVSPQQCPRPGSNCRKDEQYYQCTPFCSNRCNPLKLCPRICIKGCFCKRGLVLSDDGKCVRKDQCEKKPPNGTTCKKDEQYYQCKPNCRETCENYNTESQVCPTYCESGCGCKKGLVRRKDGKCVKPEDCPQNGTTCKKDEQYYSCKPTCRNTCANYNSEQVCPLYCQSGCDCKKGLVRRTDGKCVKPEDCNQNGSNCGKDEQYYPCTPFCTNRCTPLRACPKICKRGCFCKKGLVLSDDGKCVKKEQCGTKPPENGQCKKDEQYYDCVPSCKNNCKAYFNPGIRCGCAPAGCFCKPGLVKDDMGRCVKPEQCPQAPTECSLPDCPEGCEIDFESETCPICKCDGPPGGVQCGIPKCGPGCVMNYDTKPCPSCDCSGSPGTPPPIQCGIPKCGRGCVLRYDTKPCPSCDCSGSPGTPPPICNIPLCRVGCKIQKDPDQPCPRCVCDDSPPGTNTTEPPTGVCGKDEELVECVPCGNTCETYEQRLYCKPACRPGCTCKDGLVKRKDGKCVRPEKCTEDQNTCGYNEEIVSCAKPKWCNTCEIRGNCKLKTCTEGCDCKPGFYRDSQGICIEEALCPAVPNGGICGLDEQYYDCLPCGHTCEAINKPISCAAVCNPGCFCKPGLVKRKDGKCILPKDCQNVSALCGVDEDYKTCGTACQPSCDNPNPVCTDQCVEGCFCKEGFIRDFRGFCIPKNQCPPRACGVNEVYKTCGTDCPPTCEYPDPICILRCVEGCFCRDGFVKDSNGLCIPKDLCPKKLCPFNEIYTQCGANCQRTCTNPNPFCPAVCREGCICLNGFLRDASGTCIPESQCPQTGVCGINEVYLDCGSACQPSCNNPNPICTQQCVPGCNCLRGYVRDFSGKCIAQNQCPPGQMCGLNEEYTTCGSSCPATCDNPNPYCIEQCVVGCFCRRGYVRDSRGNCVLQNQCPRPTCGPNEQYSDCVNPCNDCQIKGNCNFLVCNKGCDCIPNYYRSPQGICIPEAFCPFYTNPEDNPRTKRDSDERYPGNEFDDEDDYYDDDDDDDNDDEDYDENDDDDDDDENDDEENGKPKKLPPKIRCDPPRCKPGCKITYKTKPCPSCDCSGNTDNNNTTMPPKIRCDPPRCKPGCKITYKTKPCPSCDCSGNTDNNNTTKCGPNERFSTCVVPCNDCVTRGKCNFLVCNEGCDCIKGYYRNEKQKCIPAKKCPKGTDSPQLCPKDQVYYPCKPTCRHTCLTYHAARAYCRKACRPGCFCKKGLVLSKDGKCVPPEDCFKQEPKCGKNEKFYDCMPLCKGTCETYDQNIACKMPCKKGCFCKSGFVKRKDGQCVRPKQCTDTDLCPQIRCKSDCYLDEDAKPCPKCVCDTKPRKPKCRKDEELYECTPFCTNRCNPLKKCPKICKNGCYCKKGLVMDDDGKCVKKGQCGKKPPGDNCKKDEQYYKCKPTCRNTCENYKSKRTACPLICKSGCDCKKGLVRQKDGKCVKPEDCNKNIPKCGKNEEYYPECKPSRCSGYCDNLDKDIKCKIKCEPGCFCKKGYLKRNDGKCVPKKQCPKDTEKCGKNEEYKSCGTACPETCKNTGKPRSCTKQCVPGCFCKKGYVKNDDGKCVKPEECDKTPKCDKKNEQYYECIPDCKNTCKNYGKPDVICPAICKSGCFCKEGLVKREKDGKCVKPERCVNEKCGKNEMYNTCGTACPETCKDKGEPRACTRQCVPGCFCCKGYVRNDDGKCVKREKCGTDETCGKNEEYQSCGTACPETCKNTGKPRPCTKQCVPGCFCKKGYVKNDDGKCVKPEKCGTDVSKCGKDEEYYPKCKPNPCETYCKFYNKGIECDYVCEPGCFCKKGLFKREDGKCVPLGQCPKDTETCGKNEEYKSCGTACPETCKNAGKPRPCTRQCVPGCFCKKGYVKNDDGKCVKREKCGTDEPECPLINCISGCYPDSSHTRCSVCVCPQKPGRSCPRIACPADCQFVTHPPKDGVEFCPRCECKNGPKMKGPPKKTTPLKPTAMSDNGDGTQKSEDTKTDEGEDYEYEETVSETEEVSETEDEETMEEETVEVDETVEEETTEEETVEVDETVEEETVEEETVEDTESEDEETTVEETGGVTPQVEKPDVGKVTQMSSVVDQGKDGEDIKEAGRKKRSASPDPDAPTGSSEPCTGPNEEHDDCGTSCPDTCDNIGQPRACTAQCVVGCFCKNGYVRNKDGKCILVEDCP